MSSEVFFLKIDQAPLKDGSGSSDVFRSTDGTFHKILSRGASNVLPLINGERIVEATREDVTYKTRPLYAQVAEG